jgi:hypothetical protein
MVVLDGGGSDGAGCGRISSINDIGSGLHMRTVEKGQIAVLNSLMLRVPDRSSRVISFVVRAIFTVLVAAPAMAQPWSFSVLGDFRNETKGLKAALNRIQAMKDVSGAASALPDFILIVGDFNPGDKNYLIYRGMFPGAGRPRFLPVIGNHDASFRKFIFRTIMPQEGIPPQFDQPVISYFLDVRNVRVIVVDQYQETGFRSGCLNDVGVRWVEEAINSAKDVDHIFIAMHEPPFCRVRHVGGGFDACPDLRNRLWDMVVRHRDKVRAIMAGHTHNYSVMRVRDPRGSASDGKSYPFEPDGVYQFDAGSAGKSVDGKITVITFHVDGKTASAEVLQSPKGQALFSVKQTVDLVAR